MTLRVPLPFPCETVPPEERFDILRVETDERGRCVVLLFDGEVVTDVSVETAWQTPRGARESREWLAREIRSGRISDLIEEDLKDPGPDPYVEVCVNLSYGAEVSVSWYWYGDGAYDGWEGSLPSAPVEAAEA